MNYKEKSIQRIDQLVRTPQGFGVVDHRIVKHWVPLTDSVLPTTAQLQRSARMEEENGDEECQQRLNADAEDLKEKP